jgi:hypothetical protein
MRRPNRFLPLFLASPKSASDPQGLKIRPRKIEPNFSRQYFRESGATVFMSLWVTRVLAKGGALSGYATSYVQAGWSGGTLVGLICLSGENRTPPGSCP